MIEHIERYYWMVIGISNNPLVITKQIPIFWSKCDAIDFLKIYGGTVVPVHVEWSADIFQKHTKTS
jgi:hypothetical protein